MVVIKSTTTQSTKPVVNIHGDGACSGNPRSGGWAAILTIPGKSNKKAISGTSDTTTTNNRRELTAAIEGLKALKKPCQLTLFSDSSYVVNTMAKSWKRNANQDLWEELDKLAKVNDVTWLWLSRNSTPELTECDRLAKEQILVS